MASASTMPTDHTSAAAVIFPVTTSGASQSCWFSNLSLYTLGNKKNRHLRRFHFVAHEENVYGRIDVARRTIPLSVQVGEHVKK